MRTNFLIGRYVMRPCLFHAFQELFCPDITNRNERYNKETRYRGPKCVITFSNDSRQQWKYTPEKD